MGKPNPAVGAGEPTPAVIHPDHPPTRYRVPHRETPSAQPGPEGSPTSAQSDPEFFLKREALRILLTKAPGREHDIKKPDVPTLPLQGRQFWQHVGGTPWMLYRLGEGLQLAHEWIKANDGYEYVMIGLVVLAGLNLEGDLSADEKLVRGLSTAAEHASSEIEDCSTELWDRWFAEEENLGINPGSVSPDDKTPSMDWMFERKIELKAQSYQVKVSQSGWIQVNGRLWKLADADTSRDAKITVENLSYDPEYGLHFKIKGSVLFFSKEASKKLDLEQSALLLERLATSEDDPTTEQIRAAGIRLTKGPESARG